MINKKTILFFVFAIVSFGMLYAEKISFSAEIMTGKTGGKSSETILQGNAYIKTSSMEINAGYIELTGENYRYIKAEGGVSGSNSESNLDFNCDTLTFDRNTKIAKLEGNVNLIDKENDVNAQAQLVEYNQDTGVAILQIKVNLTQKNNVCTASYAVYQKDQQLLELSGNAQVKQNTDTFRAQLITLDLETQDITLDGNVTGSITEKTEQQQAETDTKPAADKNPLKIDALQSEGPENQPVLRDVSSGGSEAEVKKLESTKE